MTIDSLIAYLSKDKIAVAILCFMLIVLLLNLLKAGYIYRFRKKESSNETCRFLKNLDDGLKCTNSIHRNRFQEKDNSCEGCFGRMMEMSKEEAEESCARNNWFIFSLFTLANTGKNILPYLSIVFSLLSAMSKTGLSS